MKALNENILSMVIMKIQKWKRFLIPTKKKQENVSNRIDQTLYNGKTIDKQLDRLNKKYLIDL